MIKQKIRNNNFEILVHYLQDPISQILTPKEPFLIIRTGVRMKARVYIAVNSNLYS